MRPYRHKAVVYGHCDTCGSDYDREMLKPLGRGHICCLCLLLAKERKHKDQQHAAKGVNTIHGNNE